MTRTGKNFWFILILACGLAALAVRPAVAQDASLSSYWTYDAPGPIGLVTHADLDGDGIDEFVVITQDNTVILLDATGRPIWSYSLEGSEPALLLMTVNTGEEQSSQPGIVIVTASQLHLLSSNGQLLWSRMLASPPIPDSIANADPEELASWQSQFWPAGARAFERDGDGNDEILLLLQSGELQLYDNQGEYIWSYETEDPPAGDGNAYFDIADVNRDGAPEIAFSYFGGRFSKLALIDGEGNLLWARERPVDGRVTALSLVDFDPLAPLDIAIGNNLGRVHLYDSTGQERWYRTPNKPVTSLAPAQLPEGAALLVGTEVGTVSAYNEIGDRYWRTIVSDTPDRQVIDLSASPTTPAGNQPAVAVSLAPDAGSGQELAEVFLLDSTGRRLHEDPLVSVPSATRLVDVNRDQLNELLLVSFGTLALADSGTGARKNAPAWDYRLFVAPQTMLAMDIDSDGKDELLLGASDGRLHMLESDAGQQASWIQKLGDTVPLLGSYVPGGDAQPLIVAASTERQASSDGIDSSESTIRLLDANGQPASIAVTLPGEATALAVSDINGDGVREILVGASNGEVSAFSQEMELLWQTSLGQPISHLLAVGDQQLVAGTTGNQLYVVDSEGNSRLLVNYNLNAIVDVFHIPAGDGGPFNLLVVTDDSAVRGLTSTGRESWREELNAGTPTIVVEADNQLLIATDSGRLFQLDEEQQLTEWELPEGSGISAMNWGDLSGGGANDVAIGSRSGDITLLSSDGRVWDNQGLTSGIFELVGVQRKPSSPKELIAVTDLGLVQLFEAKPNRPPLLVKPGVEVQAGSYAVSLQVLDDVGDQIQIILETFDGESSEWSAQGEQTAEGSERLTFSFSPEGSDPVRYRFRYSDQTHEGIVEPPPGPPPAQVNRGLNVVLGVVLAALAGLSLLVIARLLLSPDSRARRLHRRIKQQPEATLTLIAEAYQRSGAAPGLLLGLANHARGEQNLALANLADGLFLLTARPEAGLAIVNSALENAESQEPAWRDLDDWRTLFEMGQTLYEAPNITELSLLRPQMLQFVRDRDAAEQPVLGLSLLLRVLASLRDSERVDLAEDRLFYLHEASVLLQQLRQDLAEQPVRINKRLLTLVTLRWLGMVNTAIEELRGQAQPVVTLKTRRLIPKGEETSVELDITNMGRARAENMIIQLDDDPAYTVMGDPITIPVLTPGRSRTISFTLKPHVQDLFRLSCQIHYDDRSQSNRQMAFGDMVHLLQPLREFNAILNPYLPGTPLREKSTLFYGREELFEFISQNADRLTQRNVLILVGQRRTGKTSALLRLGAHLPETLIPIYIDCQSLGVLPGMAALMHDLAWMVADALVVRDIELNVPEPAVWREDPAGYFQRRFLPHVRSLLPENATLLLVFDEFEAFENLVRDEILPPTFFTYLRHLMQHSTGLSFVFVGTRRLEEMSTDYWSVLFNIALYRQIGFLSREAATRLICEPVAPHVVYDDLALDKIWRVTAGHPYFLQLVCYTLINQTNTKRDGYITISDVNAALAEMLRLGEVHFAYIWQRSSFTERALLAAVAHLMDSDVPFHPRDLARYLEQFGFSFDPAELTGGLNRLVEREIMQEITVEGTTLYELKIGLVGLWAEQNKSLSKLYASKDAGAASPIGPVRA